MFDDRLDVAFGGGGGPADDPTVPPDPFDDLAGRPALSVLEDAAVRAELCAWAEYDVAAMRVGALRTTHDGHTTRATGAGAGDPAAGEPAAGEPGDADEAALRAVMWGLTPGPGLGAFLAEVPITKLAEFDLVEHMRALERQRRHLDGEFAVVLDELANREVFTKCQPDDSPADDDGDDADDRRVRPHGRRKHSAIEAAADEVSVALTWTPGYAQGQVATAVALAKDLPATLAALRAGLIDAYKAQIIVDETMVFADQPDKRAKAEAAALGVASGKTGPALRAFLKRKVDAMDPTAAEERRKGARKSRSVSKPCPEADGMGSMTMFGPIEDLAALWTSVDAAARARANAAAADPDHPDHGVSLEALRFDVLADVGYSALACGHLGCCNPDCTGAGQPMATKRGKEVRVTVRMAASTAAGLDNLPAVLDGFGTISAQAARDFAADATWRRLLTDPVSGALLDFGRTTYTPPQALRDHIVARDRTCRFPTCTHPAESCDLDHAPAWNAGGQTNPDGLNALHRRHHNAKTHHGCQLDRDADGQLWWITATGHRYRIDPEIIDVLALMREGDPDPPDPPDPPDAPGDPDDRPPF